VRNGRGRAAWGACFFALSLLAVFRAPTYHLWLFALVATEWGHWLFAAALLPFAPGWSRTRGGRLGAGLGLAAAALFLTPLARAERDFERPASALDARLAAAFGPAAPRAASGAPARAAPLVFGDLWLGVRSPRVREESAAYARRGGEDLTLQLYRPFEPAPRALPVVLVVHGGSWRSGTRLEMPELSRYLAARGYAVASIDYGLAPGSTFPGPVEDVRAALAFLRARAAALSLDPERVALLGRSAGSQIVLAAAAEGARLPGVRGIVDFYGPNDMRLAWTVPGSPWILDSRGLLRDYIGGTPAEFPKRYDEATSLDRAGKDFPPTLMIHGGRDELVWPVHELRLSARLTALGVPHAFVELPWATHGCDYVFSGPCGQISTYAVERFLARILKEKGG
jgi:acetyl esterase/lipase